MNRHSNSVQNNSVEFILNLSEDKISNRESNTIYNDDLEYSIDGSRISSIVQQFKKYQHDNKTQLLQGEREIPSGMKQVERKRERKMIFEKSGFQKNIGGTLNQVKLSSGGSFGQIMTQQQIINSKIFEQVKAPPQLTRDSQTYINNNNVVNNRISQQQIGRGDSFVVNNNLNSFIGSEHNPFDFSRDSKTMQIQQNIFNNRTQYHNRSLIISNTNINQNTLQSIKLTQIRTNPNRDNVILSEVNYIESQEANNSKKDRQTSKVKQDSDQKNPSYYQTLDYSRINQSQSNISFQANTLNNQINSQIRFQPNRQQIQFKQLQTQSQIKRKQQLNQNIHVQDSIINTSQISVQSNIKGSTQSSNLISSDSLNRALGNLQQHIFLQPVLQKNIPQLLQQSHRLNSISINFLSPDFLINSIRHKQIIRNLIFQQLSATQILLKFQQDLESRQIKHNKLLRQFDDNTFLQGDWYDIFKIKYNIIRFTQNPPKRTIDFNKIKSTLKNSMDALTYLQSYVQNVKIQPSQQFKKVYIDIRSSLFQLFNNLKKISQDLYVKSTTRYLPQHFYKYYQFLQTHSESNIKLSADKANAQIEQKQQILLEISNLKKRGDPLACSKIAEQISKKIHNQLKFIKSKHIDTKAVSK